MKNQLKKVKEWVQKHPGEAAMTVACSGLVIAACAYVWKMDRYPMSTPFTPEQREKFEQQLNAALDRGPTAYSNTGEAIYHFIPEL